MTHPATVPDQTDRPATQRVHLDTETAQGASRTRVDLAAVSRRLRTMTFLAWLLVACIAALVITKARGGIDSAPETLGAFGLTGGLAAYVALAISGLWRARSLLVQRLDSAFRSYEVTPDQAQAYARLCQVSGGVRPGPAAGLVVSLDAMDPTERAESAQGRELVTLGALAALDDPDEPDGLSRARPA